MEGIQLGLKRKRRGESLKIIFIRSPTLRLEEKLVGILVRKNPQFVLDARTVSRTPAVDHSGKQRGILETRTEDVMDLTVGVKDETRHLGCPVLDGRQVRQEGELVRLFVSDLDGKRRSVYGGYVDPGRGSRLHPFGRDTHRSELFGQSMRREFADAAAFELGASDEQLAVKECSGGQNNRPRLENRPCSRTYSRDF